MNLIYLDTNVYCRPFDDQNQIRIREETEAFEEIVNLSERGKLILLSSDILIFEARNVFDLTKRFEIEEYLKLCKKHVGESEEIKILANKIKDQCKIKARDAVHAASAIIGKARYFLTCDDEVTQEKRKDCICRIGKENGNELFIDNPITFIKNWKEEKNGY